MTTSGQSTQSPRKNLADLGIELPEVAAPVASYAPAVISGDMIYVSGQLPFRNGELPATGKVGAGVSAEDAAGYARQAALNALAAINSLVDIDSVSIVKVTGFVASAPGCGGQPGVINGASDLFGDVFGTAHARSAVGVSDLPLDAPVEVEVIARRNTGAE